MTPDTLREILPRAGKRANLYAKALTDAMAVFYIDTPLRQAHFLAQIGHESGQLRYVKELASGAAYEGRKDLGNSQVGDGIKFKGRGLIQLTGRHNYTALMMALDIDSIEHPELVELPDNAARSAAWFWWNNNLNVLADRDDLVNVTKRINGGTNGIDDRSMLLKRAKKVLL